MYIHICICIYIHIYICPVGGGTDPSGGGGGTDLSRSWGLRTCPVGLGCTDLSRRRCGTDLSRFILRSQGTIGGGVA